MKLENFLNSFTDMLFVIKDHKGSIIYPKDKAILDFISQLVKMNDNEFFHQYTKAWYRLSSSTAYDNGKRYTIYRYTDITHYKKQNQTYELDETTGIFLKKKLFSEYKKYILEAKEREEEFSVIMADIDFFKKVNDTYGHHIGDEVLFELAQILFNNIRHNDETTLVDSKYKPRPKDLLGRFGGEEFFFVLKNIPADITLERVESIRKIIEQTDVIRDENTINITCSFGIVHTKLDNLRKVTEETVDEYTDLTISASDSALYESKQNGRNRVTLAR